MIAPMPQPHGEQAEVLVWPSKQECWEAARWTLLAFSLVVALTLAGSFVPYEQVVVEGHPWLPRKICTGCPLCGMTRSFCAMSSGRFAESFGWNRGGPALYVCGWLWLLASAFVTARRVHRRLAA